jgi:hypothetical protein
MKQSANISEKTTDRYALIALIMEAADMLFAAFGP